MALGGEEALDPGPVDAQQRLDRGEGEALGLELADLDQPVEVLRGRRACAGPTAPGALEQAFAGVVPDRVDRDPGLVGQLVDTPPGLGQFLRSPG